MRAGLNIPVRSLLALLVMALLAAVFVAYLRPGFVLDLANRLWMCW